MDDHHKPLVARLHAALDAGMVEIDDLLAALLGDGGSAKGADPAWRPIAAVGGAELDLSPRGGFESEFWLDRYRGDRERGIYLASCSGLKALEAILGTGLSKASTCAPGRLAERMDEVRRDRTGSVWHDGERHLRAADGWTDWFARQIRPVVGPSPGSPVVVEDRLLTMRLPDTLHWQAFDRAFDARVREGALDRWTLTEEGLARCAALEFPSARLRRFTPYGGGGDVRLSPAQEICLLDPVDGPDRLIRIIEDILLDHVLGDQADSAD